MSEPLRKGGMNSPLAWYRLAISGMLAEDEKNVPPSRTLPPTATPLFFAACKRDYVCLASAGKQLFNSASFQHHQSVTIKEFDTGHWVMLEVPDEVNRELGRWVEGVVGTGRTRCSSITRAPSHLQESSSSSNSSAGPGKRRTVYVGA